MCSHTPLHEHRERQPGHIVWEGNQDAREPGDLIGMLLDLDQGSVTVWKGGVMLAMMQAEGLGAGWLGCHDDTIYRQHYSARIESIRGWA